MIRNTRKQLLSQIAVVTITIFNLAAVTLPLEPAFAQIQYEHSYYYGASNYSPYHYYSNNSNTPCVSIEKGCARNR
jgi:hypothetical protein